MSLGCLECLFLHAGAVFHLCWYSCDCFLHTAETGECMHEACHLHMAPPSASSRLSADDDASDDEAIVAAPHPFSPPARTSAYHHWKHSRMSCEQRGESRGRLNDSHQHGNSISMLPALPDILPPDVLCILMHNIHNIMGWNEWDRCHWDERATVMASL